MPSSLTAAMGITRSPIFSPGFNAPALPILMKYLPPQAISSSTAMAQDGPPMPVEVIVTGTPLYTPVMVLNSRLKAISLASSKNSAALMTLWGAPGKITFSAIWPFLQSICGCIIVIPLPTIESIIVYIIDGKFVF